MLGDNKAYSGFSVNDLAAAKQFYERTLGLGVEDGPMGFRLKLASHNDIFVYPKEDHLPASYTMLNFVVEDIDQAVEDLTAKGVSFEQYAGVTDEKGIARGLAAGRGPDIAWFKDPAGNIMSVLTEA